MTLSHRLIQILAANALVAALCWTTNARADDPPVASTWTRHEQEVHYAVFMSELSCDQLEYKLRLLLRAAGARRDVTVKTNCIVVSGASPDATARVTFYTLVPKGVGAAAGEDPGGSPAQDTVQAVWRKVRLGDHRPMELRAIDCHLVQTFREKLLPLFTTRAIADRNRCRLGEVSAGDIDLQFEVLQAPAGRAIR